MKNVFLVFAQPGRKGSILSLASGLVVVGAILLVSLVACQSRGEAVAAAMPPFTPTVPLPATLTPVPTLPDPALITTVVVTTGHEQPVFKPIGAPEDGATAIPTAIPPTPTPGPTFTPPAPADQTLAHFWLARPVAQGGVVWTNKYYPYGSTRGGSLRPHHGVEFDVPYGTEILAAASGVVVFAGADNETQLGPQTDFYGNVVVIQHAFTLNSQPVFSLYGHLSQIDVTVGQSVEGHSIIGLSGYSGVADGPHLHFEVRVGTNSYTATRNPLLWLEPFPDRGVVVGRVTLPNGALLAEAPVNLHRVDASSNYAATTSYARESLNADGYWQENFAFDDVYAGYYEVVVTQGNKKYEGAVWVYVGQISFVTIVVEPVLVIEEELP